MNRKPQGYSVQGLIPVWVGYGRYWVSLSPEYVLGEVNQSNGRTTYRKVTSRRIETAALIRASDKVNQS